MVVTAIRNDKIKTDMEVLAAVRPNPSLCSSAYCTNKRKNQRPYSLIKRCLANIKTE